MKEQIFILDCDYIKRGSRSIIRIWGKTKKGKTVVLFVEDYYPYFFVLPKNPQKAKKEIEEILKKANQSIKEIKITKRKLRGEEKEVIQITCFKASHTQKLRDLIKVLEKKRGGSGSVINEYEYEINFYRKFLMDKKIDGACWVEVEGKEVKPDFRVDIAIFPTKIKPLDIEDKPRLKILAFDIETYEEKGERKVIMISLVSENYQKVLTYKKAKYPKWVEVVQNEKELLKRFVEEIQKLDPDIILTYYGDSFDFEVLDERCQKNKVKLILSRDNLETRFARRARISAARLNGAVHIDLFNFIQNILSPNLQTEVLTLDAVAQELLKDQKIQLEFEEIIEAWRREKDLEKLAQYCKKDSELTLKLGKILLPQIFELSKVVGQTLFDVSRMTYSQLVEWHLLRKANDKNELLPNQPKFDEILKRKRFTYAGGFVKEPIGGIHKNLAVLDFRSSYPSIIITFNISPETFKCTCCKDDGYKVPGLNYWFCKKKKGFIPDVLEELMKRRLEIKAQLKKLKKSSLEYETLDNRQFAIKTILNATYGYMGFPASRYYCKECAESAAAFGRYWIRKVIKEAENFGLTVVYGDTDSIFVKADKNIQKEIEKFLGYINKKLPGRMELDLQGVYLRGIFIPRGIAPGTAKKRYALLDKEGKLLIRGLETVRRDWCNLAKRVQKEVLNFVLKEENMEEAKKFVKNIIKDLKEQKISLRDLTIYEDLTKPIEEYKLVSPHVVAAKKMKERGIDVEPGQTIMFVITKKGTSISEKAEPVEFVEIKEIDIDYYIHHQIIPAALRVLKVLGIDEKDLL